MYSCFTTSMTSESSKHRIGAIAGLALHIVTCSNPVPSHTVLGIKFEANSVSETDPKALRQLSTSVRTQYRLDKKKNYEQYRLLITKLGEVQNRDLENYAEQVRATCIGANIPISVPDWFSQMFPQRNFIFL